MKKKRLLFMLFAFLAFGPTAWAQSIVIVSYIDADEEPQTVNATLLDEIASVNPNGATIGTSGFTNWYVVQSNNVVMNGQLGYYGGINLILCDGAKYLVAEFTALGVALFSCHNDNDNDKVGKILSQIRQRVPIPLPSSCFALASLKTTF